MSRFDTFGSISEWRNLGEAIRTVDNLKRYLFAEIKDVDNDDTQRKNFRWLLAKVYLEFADNSPEMRDDVLYKKAQKHKEDDKPLVSDLYASIKRHASAEEIGKINQFFLDTLMKDGSKIKDISYEQAYKNAKDAYQKEAAEAAKNLPNGSAAAAAAASGSALGTTPGRPQRDDDDAQVLPSPAAAQPDLGWWIDGEAERKKNAKESVNAASLSSFNELWKKPGSGYSDVKFKLNDTPNKEAITTSDNTTDIKLKAEVIKAGEKQIVDINLTLVKDPKSKNVTMTCNAEGIPEAMQYQLIAAQFLKLREASGMGLAAGVVEIFELSPAERGGDQVDSGFKDSKGNVVLLSPREKMMIKGHFDAGYTEVTYGGHTITPDVGPVRVAHRQADPVLPLPERIDALRKQLSDILELYVKQSQSVVSSVVSPSRAPIAESVRAVQEAVETKVEGDGSEYCRGVFDVIDRMQKGDPKNKGDYANALEDCKKLITKYCENKKIDLNAPSAVPASPS